MAFRNEGDERPGRVVVGVEVTLSGLQALRVAVVEARRRRAVLHAVRVWGAGPVDPPSGTATAGLTGPLGTGAIPREESTLPGTTAMAAEAGATIARAFEETMGGEPPDLTIQQVVLPDAPGPVLTEYACREDDLLVVGVGQRRRWWRPRGSPVVRYCLRHAACPVLVIPPPPLTRAGSPRSLMRQLRRELDQLADGGTER